MVNGDVRFRWANAFASSQTLLVASALFRDLVHSRRPSSSRHPSESWGLPFGQRVESEGEIPAFAGVTGVGGVGVEGGERGDRVRGMAWVRDNVGSSCLLVLPRRQEPSLGPRLRGETSWGRDGCSTKNAPGFPEASSLLAGLATGVNPVASDAAVPRRPRGGPMALVRLSLSSAASRTGGTAVARRSSIRASSRRRPRGCRPPPCRPPATRSG